MPRPSNPLLSAGSIRASALALIDVHGLEAVSMRKIAEHLGVRAASLYNHVSTKDELLHQIANEIMDRVDTTAFDTGWEIGLRTWARSYRSALAEHPNLVPFLASGPARRDAALRRADAVHGGLTRAGWPRRYATMIGASTKYLVVGAAMGSFSRGFVDEPTVYDGRFPNLDQAHRLAEHAPSIDHDSFELALSALVDGLRTVYEQVAERHPEPQPE